MGKIRVQLKRANFVEPTEDSVICKVHFSPDCYEKGFMVEMGLRKQSPRLSGAVPTIQSRAGTKSAGKLFRMSLVYSTRTGSATRTCLPR